MTKAINLADYKKQRLRDTYAKQLIAYYGYNKQEQAEYQNKSK